MADDAIIVVPNIPQIIIQAPGPQGASGVQTVAYKHTQTIASNTWNITHNLNFFPNVTVQDSAGTICEGEIVYTSVNALTLTFSGSFAGVAYLS